MRPRTSSRRDFVKALGAGAVALPLARAATSAPHSPPGRSQEFPQDFLLGPDELTLRYHPPVSARKLSFARFEGTPEEWRTACRGRLARLLGVGDTKARPVRRLRQVEHDGVRIQALVMDLSDQLTLPAYLLTPARGPVHPVGVMAIHGHGEVEPAIGAAEEYHRRFALQLAQAGRAVLAPELRGFGNLRDVSKQTEDLCLDYWAWDRGPQFTLVTDGFLHGQTLVGLTTADLLRWEEWWAAEGMASMDVAGISYGGDLCLTYGAFSRRARRVFCSGSFGSFEPVFSRCYNAPAHCVPGVLEWMDRSDIAGLGAPRPIAFHFGDQDVIAPWNNSAAYNDTVAPALEELRAIYRAFGADPDLVRLVVTKDSGHVMDVPALKAFLGD